MGPFMRKPQCFSAPHPRILVIAMLLGFCLGGCPAETPLLTMPTPRVYTDDQMLKIMAARRQALRTSVLSSIPIDMLQELLTAKQQTQTTINVNATPATGTANQPTTPAQPPQLPGLTNLTVPPNFGLSPEGEIRKRIALDQEITGYELLYLGDAQFLKADMQAVLLRVDLSINNFTNFSKIGEGALYLLLGFCAQAQVDDQPISDKTSVYMLEPEYVSITGLESALSSHIERLAGQGMTGTVALGGSYQRSLEEDFLSIVETPLQRAIYSNEKNQFAFALGPRRRVVKRSWINPVRWFWGDTYQIDYELEPGLRTMYALLALPKQANTLRLQYWNHGVLSEKKLRKKPVTEITPPKDACDATFTLPIVRSTSVPTKDQFWPDEVYTGQASQLLIESAEPVTADTQVFIGSLPVSNVTVLGRYRLQVSLPVVTNAPATAKIFLVTPDRPRREFPTEVKFKPPPAHPH